jgi:hypothetical protein
MRSFRPQESLEPEQGETFAVCVALTGADTAPVKVTVHTSDGHAQRTTLPFYEGLPNSQGVVPRALRDINHHAGRIGWNRHISVPLRAPVNGVSLLRSEGRGARHVAR